MNVTLGFKSHSGWAVMVAIASNKTGPEVITRRRIELIEEGELWAKQPYHAAEHLPLPEARKIVKNGINSAQRVAKRRLKEILIACANSNLKVLACGVITPEPMPNWSSDEILAVHFRMHKAEGVLFPDALAKGAEANNIPLLAVREKRLDDISQKSFGRPVVGLMKDATELGRTAGPPWGKDHKLATIAAMIALKEI